MALPDREGQADFVQGALRQIEGFLEHNIFGEVGTIAMADLAELEEARAGVDLINLDSKYRPQIETSAVDVAVAAARLAGVKETVRSDFLRRPLYKAAFLRAQTELFGPLASEASTRVLIPESAKNAPTEEIADLRYGSALGRQVIAEMISSVVNKQ